MDLIREIPWRELLWYLPLGAMAGLLAGLLGVGGGLIIVPALMLVFVEKGFVVELLPQLAVGTSLATIVATSVASAYSHHRRGAVQWGLVAGLTPGILVGAWIGAAMASWLPGPWLRRLFAVFALVVGTRMVAMVRAQPRYPMPGGFGLGVAGALIGAMSSLVGIGGGSLTVPFLTACRLDVRRSVATSSACGLPIALAGAVGFVILGWHREGLPPASAGYVYWPAALAIMLTSVAAAPLGAALAHSLPVQTLKRLFGVLLFAIGIRLLC